MEQEDVRALMVRQPVFDQNLKIVAYQLRFQPTEEETGLPFDHEQEGSMLLMNTFASLSQDGKSCKVPLFIPFPPDMLSQGQMPALPKKQLVVELASDIEVSSELVKSLKLLRNAGFRLALDGFAMQPRLFPLIKLMHMVNVDFRIIHRKTLPKLINLLGHSGITAMAENVDDFEALQFAKRMHFKLLHGRFLSRPSQIQAKEVPGDSIALWQLMSALEDPEVSPEEIEELIVVDPILTFKMLRVVNSAAYNLVRPVDSIKQAVVVLGIEQVRKWVLLINMASRNGKPEELSRNLLVRARMCELLAETSGIAKPESAFMMGVISQLDLLLDVEMSALLRQIPLRKSIKLAISHHRGDLGLLLGAVMAFEEGDWAAVDASMLDKRYFDVAYRHSMGWAEHAMQALNEMPE